MINNKYLGVTNSYEWFARDIDLNLINVKKPIIVHGKLAERIASRKLAKAKVSLGDKIKDFFLDVFSENYRSAKALAVKNIHAFKYKYNWKKIDPKNDPIVKVYRAMLKAEFYAAGEKIDKKDKQKVISKVLEKIFTTPKEELIKEYILSKPVIEKPVIDWADHLNEGIFSLMEEKFAKKQSLEQVTPTQPADAKEDPVAKPAAVSDANTAIDPTKQSNNTIVSPETPVVSPNPVDKPKVSEKTEDEKEFSRLQTQYDNTKNPQEKADLKVKLAELFKKMIDTSSEKQPKV